MIAHIHMSGVFFSLTFLAVAVSRIYVRFETTWNSVLTVIARTIWDDWNQWQMIEIPFMYYQWCNCTKSFVNFAINFSHFFCISSDRIKYNCESINDFELESAGNVVLMATLKVILVQNCSFVNVLQKGRTPVKFARLYAIHVSNATTIWSSIVRTK